MKAINFGFLFAVVLFVAVGAFGQDGDPVKPLQNVVASRSAKFETVNKNDAVYKDALDAHDLAGALKMVGQLGSFRGTVDQLFEERDGDLIILQFDPKIRTAVTASLKNAYFPKFPVVRDLKGKEVVVTGKWINFHGKAQIELTDPAQIKIVN